VRAAAMQVDDAMDVDGAPWDDPPVNDGVEVTAGVDFMEVDAEVVREALRSLSASRKGGCDFLLGDPTGWPGVWPGMWPVRVSSAGSRALPGGSTPFAPCLTVVPDTNALVARGGASLAMLLDRFGSGHGQSASSADGVNTFNDQLQPPPRIRLAVPRRVVQELDGLKSSHGGNEKVAALARGVTRSLVARLDAQHRNVDEKIKNSTASLEVQGPGDAAAARLDMRNSGCVFVEGDAPQGDEEIIYFCQTRRKKNELVAFITADANAAVTAMSDASDFDTPVMAFHPDSLPANAHELGEALVAFYHAVEAKRTEARKKLRICDARKAPKSALSGPETLEQPVPRGDQSGDKLPDVSMTEDRTQNKADVSITEDGTQNKAEGTSPEEKPEKKAQKSSPLDSPGAYAAKVLRALDAALPSAVEFILKQQLGDLWACGVSDDFDGTHALTADDAFETLRKNLSSLLPPRIARRGARDGGREAMRLLASARRAVGTHAEARELGSIDSATEVVSVVTDVLGGFNEDLPEVRAAKATAAAAATALARIRRE